jgi:hypothetical protein
MSLIEPCDALYVSARAGEAELACAARMISERERGLRVLVVTLFDQGPERDGELFLGLPRANERIVTHDPGAQQPPGVDEETWIAATAAILDDVFVRTRPKHLYIPLGVGGLVERRVAHEAALRTFQAEAGRDVFLYEERPEAFISGSVRIRLAQLGARLPPAASRVAGEGGLARYMLRFQTVPRLRDAMKGPWARLRSVRAATRLWFDARAWRPQKAKGLRLQPLLQIVAPAGLADVSRMIRTSAEKAGVPAIADRIVALSSHHARRLGASGHAERYWLLLPRRENEIRSVVTGEEVSALSPR